MTEARKSYTNTKYKRAAGEALLAKDKIGFHGSVYDDINNSESYNNSSLVCS